MNSKQTDIVQDNQPVSAYQEGWQAYMDGVDAVSPYHALSERGKLWLNGWHTAKFGEVLKGWG